jgi:uncharacterized phiE125 gp8 family phage protein
MTPLIITDATVEPLTYEDMVNHSVLPFDQWRDLVEDYISVARASCEDHLNSTISPKLLEIATESFASCDWINWASLSEWSTVSGLPLPLGPVQSIVSVKYIDPDGVEQTLANTVYVLDRYRRTALLRLAYGESWPSVRSQFDAVKVQYLAGYAFNDSPPVAVPARILQAMRLLVDHMIANRSAVDVDNLVELPLGVKYHLDPLRLELGV